MRCGLLGARSISSQHIVGAVHARDGEIAYILSASADLVGSFDNATRSRQQNSTSQVTKRTSADGVGSASDVIMLMTSAAITVPYLHGH